MRIKSNNDLQFLVIQDSCLIKFIKSKDGKMFFYHVTLRTCRIFIDIKTTLNNEVFVTHYNLVNFITCTYCLSWTSKKIIQPSLAFPPLYQDFYRLLIATSIDHWVPRTLFANLIN